MRAETADEQWSKRDRGEWRLKVSDETSDERRLERRLEVRAKTADEPSVRAERPQISGDCR